MKKVFAVVLVLAMLATLIACGKKEETAGGATKFGMAVVTSASTEEAKATLGAVAAVVLTDANGKILACALDEISVEPTIENGAVKELGEVKTKYELGDNYNMVAYGQAKAEWYKQVDAFCAYVVGKTADEVAAIALEGGKATDADLTAGCTIVVANFVKAVSDAAKAAVDSQAAADDKLSVALTASANEGEYTVEIAGVAVDANGKLTDCRIDELAQKFEVADGKFAAVTDAAPKTKAQLGDAYNMVAYGQAKAEWYQQVDSLAKYLVGKTADEVVGVKTEGGKGTDADLTAGCTIVISGMLQNVNKAMK